MNVKEYLNSHRHIVRGIRIKLQRIQELRELAESTKGAMAERISGTNKRSHLENCITTIYDLECEIQADITLMRDRENHICKLIKKVDDKNLQDLLELRYINGYTWEKVAVEMDFSYVHIVHRLHPKALNKIGNVIECNTLDMV